MTYKSRIPLTSYFWGLLMLTFTIWLSYPSMQEGRFFGMIFFGCLSVAVWYFTFIFPSYKIEGKKLLGRRIGTNMNIEINTIRKIEMYTHLWGIGIFKPVQKGLLIHYDRFEDVFVNPVNQIDFIKHLRTINPDIELVGKDMVA
ncbi:PH domain-containing protein [Sphingobacterium sp. SRCM116780]|uniref:PH domain-containing protein n=1 Tax=Sphingobacterium sp. SRCM116780 TaxID=2907623 RepID=UPI001F31B54D|nr:PH domain-containing protein [Sphingobacterium sp. SRCM116780]UIR56267.1 PH domain-containing protein [Sphingobacterium sp. SRCM116780]